MNRKPVFTVCFVTSVLLFAGFQLWADGPDTDGPEPQAIKPVVNDFQPAVAADSAKKEHDLGDGIRATVKQNKPNDLAGFSVTVENTSELRARCAVEVRMTVSEQSFMSRVPTPPTVKKKTEKMVVWLDPGQSKTQTIKTGVSAMGAMGAGVQVTLVRGETVLADALTMGVVAPERAGPPVITPVVLPKNTLGAKLDNVDIELAPSAPIKPALRPKKVKRALPKATPRNAVLTPELFAAPNKPVAAN